jgi:hypothetical protein
MADFEDSIGKCVQDLENAMTNLQTTIQFHPCPIDLSVYQHAEDYISAIHHPEVIKALEGMVLLSIRSLTYLKQKQIL